MAGKERQDIAKMLAEEAELAERDRDGPVRYARVGRPPKPPAERGQVYSIRVPVERLEDLRQVAEARGKPPAVLARDWILERLDSERGQVLRLPSRVREPVTPYRSSPRAAARTAAKRAAKTASRRKGSRTKTARPRRSAR